MAAAASGDTQVVAVVAADARDGHELAWCLQDGRLPRITADWPELSELVPGRDDLVPMAPRQRVGNVNVHVLLARNPAPPTASWSRLVPLPQVADESEVVAVIQRSLQHWHRPQSRPATREPWFSHDYLESVARSGPLPSGSRPGPTAG